LKFLFFCGLYKYSEKEHCNGFLFASGDSFSDFREIVLEKTAMPEYFTGLVF
jgi:hypothetical protein